MKLGKLSTLKVLLILLSTLGLSACSETTTLDAGGDIVPPYPGTWISNLGEEIELESLWYDDQYFATHYEVTARLRDFSDGCDLPTDGQNSFDLEGLVFENSLELFVPGTDRDTPCLTGRFTSMVTMDATLSDGSLREFRSVRVDVKLNRENGIWLSSNSGSLRVAFIGPNSVNNNGSKNVEGCLLTRDVNIYVDAIEDASLGITRITGEMRGYDTELNQLPKIDTLENMDTGEVVFNNLMFINAHTLSGTLANGDLVTLHRAPILIDSDIYDLCPVL